MSDNFSILIIEDTVEKVKVIHERISAELTDLDVAIDVATNLVEALKLLEQRYFDLVILDILIPAVNSRPSAEHSRTIIEQLRSGRLVMPACVIGLTAYEKEYKSELKYYSENLFSIEHFSNDDDQWITNIIARIRFISRWKLAYGRARCYDYDIDVVLIVTRYENEYLPILSSIEWSTGPNKEELLFRERKCQTGLIKVGSHSLRVGIFCIEEMGLAAAAASAAQLIDQFRPRILFMLGMCCGFRQDICYSPSKLGDIIVVREVACWDEGRYGEVNKEGFFFNRAKPHFVSKEVDRLVNSLVESQKDQFVGRLKKAWEEKSALRIRKKFKEEVGAFPDIKYGLLLSGSSVIAHDLKGDEIIKRFPNALGLEMEVFGIFKAADRSVGVSPAVMAVKGVADFGDGSKHKKFQSLASRLSYHAALHIIEKFFDSLLANKETRWR